MTNLPSASSLDAVLDELGWKPEALARRLNTFAAQHGRAERMHVKTPTSGCRALGLAPHGLRWRLPWSPMSWDA